MGHELTHSLAHASVTNAYHSLTHAHTPGTLRAINAKAFKKASVNLFPDIQRYMKFHQRDRKIQSTLALDIVNDISETLFKYLHE